MFALYIVVHNVWLACGQWGGIDAAAARTRATAKSNQISIFWYRNLKNMKVENNGKVKVTLSIEIR